jgi:hypothetical protein
MVADWDDDKDNNFSMLFSQYANKFEQYLRKNGVSCRDADIIIEESSVFYFEKTNSSNGTRFKLLKKQNPAQIFAQSAARAIERHMPEAKSTFGSYGEIAKHII